MERVKQLLKRKMRVQSKLSIIVQSIGPMFTIELIIMAIFNFLIQLSRLVWNLN
jgi:hypothetical protein